jgi:hypothetical protein
MRILPAQKNDCAIKEGRKPDDALSTWQSCAETKHLHGCAGGVHHDQQPLPGATYGDRYNWAVLSVLILWGGWRRSSLEELSYISPRIV